MWLQVHRFVMGVRGRRRYRHASFSHHSQTSPALFLRDVQLRFRELDPLVSERVLSRRSAPPKKGHTTDCP
jgi:hypothetical protein